MYVCVWAVGRGGGSRLGVAGGGRCVVVGVVRGDGCGGEMGACVGMCVVGVASIAGGCRWAVWAFVRAGRLGGYLRGQDGRLHGRLCCLDGR